MRIRYSRWDGTQNVGDLDADDLLEAMSDDLVADGDIRRALQRLFQRGAQMPQGKMPGLQDLLKQLRQKRQKQLERYDLGSTLDDIKKKVDEILKTERAGIEARRTDARERAERGEIPEDARRQLVRWQPSARPSSTYAPRSAGGSGAPELEVMTPRLWSMFRAAPVSARDAKALHAGHAKAMSNSGPRRQRSRDDPDRNRMMRTGQRAMTDFRRSRQVGKKLPGVRTVQIMELWERWPRAVAVET